MWRWRSTSNFTKCNVAYYNWSIHDRKWHFASGKSTTVIALVTMNSTVGANTWRKVEGEIDAYQVNVKEMCTARVLQAYINALETMALTEKFEVRVKERSKKELLWSTWAGHVDKNGRWKTVKREQMPKPWRGTISEEDRNSDWGLH